ncbi:MAG: DUF3592 domain-containing protein [Betaproteobacteria bacterium]|nr:DUF3592 domain-containing protein [Betaproteobacteria bacterium]
MGRALGVVACLLLALPFLGAGGFAAWVAGKTLVDAQRVRDWVLVKAEVRPGPLGTAPGAPGSSHIAYTFEGRAYEGRRLALGGLTENDDIDEWRTEIADTLQQAKASGRSLSVWVNPDNPAESVFDRSLPLHVPILYGLLAFGLGIAGLMAFFAALALARGQEADGTLPNTGTGAVFLWIFGVIWSGMSFLISFLVLPDVLASREWAGLFVLLFPFVGVFLIWGAMGATTTAIKVGVARVSGRRPKPREKAAPLRGFVDTPMREAGGFVPNGGDLPSAIATTTLQGGVLTVRFSRRRRLTPAIILLAVGGLLTMAGLVMVLDEGPGPGAILLLLVASLVDVGAVAFLVGTLEVRARTGEIAVDRSGLFGRKSWQLRRDSIKAIRPVLSYTVNDVPVFEIRAEMTSGEEVLLGDSLRGESLAGPYAARLAAAAGFPSSLVRAPATSPSAGT